MTLIINRCESQGCLRVGDAHALERLERLEMRTNRRMGSSARRIVAPACDANAAFDQCLRTGTMRAKRPIGSVTVCARIAGPWRAGPITGGFSWCGLPEMPGHRVGPAGGGYGYCSKLHSTITTAPWSSGCTSTVSAVVPSARSTVVGVEPVGLKDRSWYWEAVREKEAKRAPAKRQLAEPVRTPYDPEPLLRLILAFLAGIAFAFLVLLPLFGR